MTRTLKKSDLLKMTKKELVSLAMNNFHFDPKGMTKGKIIKSICSVNSREKDAARTWMGQQFEKKKEEKTIVKQARAKQAFEKSITSMDDSALYSEIKRVIEPELISDDTTIRDHFVLALTKIINTRLMPSKMQISLRPFSGRDEEEIMFDFEPNATITFREEKEAWAKGGAINFFKIPLNHLELVDLYKKFVKERP